MMLEDSLLCLFDSWSVCSCFVLFVCFCCMFFVFVFVFVFACFVFWGVGFFVCFVLFVFLNYFKRPRYVLSCLWDRTYERYFAFINHL